MRVLWRNGKKILISAAAALLTLNLADLITTWYVVGSGRGVEANPIAGLLGGPFSPLELVLKVVVFPVSVLGVAWWLTRRFKDSRPAMVAIIAPAAVYAAAVANNVIVAAKKAKKTVAREA
jgi:hypothetical protein